MAELSEFRRQFLCEPITPELGPEHACGRPTLLLKRDYLGYPICLCDDCQEKVHTNPATVAAIKRADRFLAFRHNATQS